jgi:hypothetical protein
MKEYKYKINEEIFSMISEVTAIQMLSGILLGIGSLSSRVIPNDDYLEFAKRIDEWHDKVRKELDIYFK